METADLARSLRAAYLDLYRPHKLAGRSEKTHGQYLIQIGHLEEFLGRAATLADLTDETIVRAMGWLRSRRRAAPTVNKFRSHLLALWRFLARKHLVRDWPDVLSLPEPERVPRAWSAAELGRLLSTCRGLSGSVAGVPAGRWWFALHLVLWDTGERITAVTLAQWDDLDTAGRWLKFPAENRKFGRRDRQFRLHVDTVSAVQKISRPARRLIFPWPLAHSSLWDHYTAILAEAGLPTDKRSRPTCCFGRIAQRWSERKPDGRREQWPHNLARRPSPLAS